MQLFLMMQFALFSPTMVGEVGKVKILSFPEGSNNHIR